MAQNAHVPKFGNWDSEGDVPYTQRFEVVRKVRNEGKMINPNDPQENPEAFNENSAASNPKDEVHASREDYLHQPTQSPLRHGTGTHKSSTESSPLHRHGYQRNSGEHSIERSPHHPHYQVKAATRAGVSSPSRGPPEGGHTLPGRSRMRTGGRGDETPEKGSSVPKFGEWDENNPSSADGFTGIFEKVREEKKHGPAKSPMISTDMIYTNDQDGASSSCCFGWCKK
ncbi:RPM1-interacting protein 4-like isoform X1 [Canna indica]|uniref:RPM1-interacting protein 4-like isoform X1 n=1 Tax=Canna indica TaxID=4628 RepID=A0AAQ3JWC8_9LILI|nr:RPM1-interacting protein 4-like isoform X1 [Canna indica]